MILRSGENIYPFDIENRLEEHSDVIECAVVGVDHTVHDTTSILATIERRFGLAPLGTRDANASDLSTVFAAHPED